LQIYTLNLAGTDGRAARSIERDCWEESREADNQKPADTPTGLSSDTDMHIYVQSTHTHSPITYKHSN